MGPDAAALVCMPEAQEERQIVSRLDGLLQPLLEALVRLPTARRG